MFNTPLSSDYAIVSPLMESNLKTELKLFKIYIYKLKCIHTFKYIITYSCDVPGCNPGCQNCWKIITNLAVIKITYSIRKIKNIM